MLFANILLGITSFITLLLCFVVVVSNPKKHLNQTLALFLFSLFLWPITNLLTNISPTASQSLIFARTTLIGPALVPFTFLLFTKVYLDEKIRLRTTLLQALIPAIVLLSTPTSLNIVSIDAYGLNTVTGPIYYLMIFEFVVYFGLALVKLVRRLKLPSTTAIQRSQIRYIFSGVLLTLIPGIIANAILPTLGYGEALFYGPSCVIFLGTLTSLAIIKHKFLDIRLIVARSITYVLLLSSLIAIYSLLIFLVSTQIVTTETSDFLRNSIPFLAAILLAITYRPLKRFFDRTTNKYFYQDAYEPQDLLNDLNRSLVSSIDIDVIMRESALLIEHYLKPTYVNFYIRKDEDAPKKLFSTNKQLEHNKEIYHVVQKFSDKVTSVSDDSKLVAPVRQQASELEVGLVALLLSANQSDTVRSGSIVLGPKKSGSIYGKQDVRAMEIIADELVIAIQNALRFEEIQQFNITLQEKVDKATGELRKANQKLIALDQTKDDFISMASHQLRTPLTSVKGYVSMVLEGDVGKVNKEQKKLLDQAFLSSQRMVYLIADLLNVSRLKTGKFVIEPKPTNLADLVETELEQLKETAAARDLEIKYDKPKDFPVLNLDDTKIRQVVMNFADNAIYYTPAGGHIQVTVAEKGESVEFTVTDDGIGVPKEEQHNLFTKFYRANNAKKARPDGTGLGLFMAKKVVIAQGGNIIFKTVENKGSTFGFSFEKKKLVSGTHSVKVEEEATD